MHAVTCAFQRCFQGVADKAGRAGEKDVHGAVSLREGIWFARYLGLCCGAGGSQMFKEDEPGDKRINVERTGQLTEVFPDIIAVACPFCNTMITDGVKGENKQDDIKVLDIAELVAQANSY